LLSRGEGFRQAACHLTTVASKMHWGTRSLVSFAPLSTRRPSRFVRWPIQRCADLHRHKPPPRQQVVLSSDCPASSTQQRTSTLMRFEAPRKLSCCTFAHPCGTRRPYSLAHTVQPSIDRFKKPTIRQKSAPGLASAPAEPPRARVTLTDESGYQVPVPSRPSVTMQDTYIEAEPVRSIAVDHDAPAPPPRTSLTLGRDAVLRPEFAPASRPLSVAAASRPLSVVVPTAAPEAPKSMSLLRM
jgi:hypothetical protein